MKNAAKASKAQLGLYHNTCNYLANDRLLYCYMRSKPQTDAGDARELTLHWCLSLLERLT